MYITYLSRPVWDSSNENSFIPIQHYYTEGIDQQALCKLHGWKYSNTSNKVIDAIIFANELDLLEIRLRELYSVVDKFVIVESATTFTGNPKPTHFHNNRKRFAFAEDKIVYGLFKSPPVTAREAKTSMVILLLLPLSLDYNLPLIIYPYKISFISSFGASSLSTTHLPLPSSFPCNERNSSE